MRLVVPRGLGRHVFPPVGVDGEGHQPPGQDQDGEEPDLHRVEGDDGRGGGERQEEPVAAAGAAGERERRRGDEGDARRSEPRRRAPEPRRGRLQEAGCPDPDQRHDDQPGQLEQQAREHASQGPLFDDPDPFLMFIFFCACVREIEGRKK